MSTFICEKCGCIDNTANNGNYWAVMSRRHSKPNNKRPGPFTDEYYNSHIVCSACCPGVYQDGSGDPEKGFKWDAPFDKKHWSKRGTMEQHLKECSRNVGNVVNAVDYFNKYGKHGHDNFIDDYIPGR